MPSSEVTNITINSNPLKAKNRELLNPTLREALEYATDRDAIVKVIYAGYARPWANMLSLQSGKFWLNPAIKPLPFDIGKANQILDSLGYKMGPGGIRVVPATTGKYAQPAHKMEYNVIVPDSLDFNGDRQFQIIANDWKQGRDQAERGRRRRQRPGLRPRDGRQLHQVRLRHVGLGRVRRPRRAALVHDPRRSGTAGTTPATTTRTFNKQYLQQATLINPKQRQALVWKMEAEVAHDRPYIQLVDEDTGDGQRQAVDGLLPRPERLLQVLLHPARTRPGEAMTGRGAEEPPT